MKIGTKVLYNGTRWRYQGKIGEVIAIDGKGRVIVAFGISRNLDDGIRCHHASLRKA